VALTNISQTEIDAAADLPIAFVGIEHWLLAAATKGWPTCGWGPIDRKRLAMNAHRCGVWNPLASRAHIDLRDVMTALVNHPTQIDRDELRRLKALPANPRRHRALDDALDLTHFIGLLPWGAPCAHHAPHAVGPGWNGALR